MSRTPAIVLDGLDFPECPRWHDDRLFFSDQHARRVCAMDTDGKLEEIVDVIGQPSGLGWLPDGSMLVVSMHDQRVLRYAGGELVEHADLSNLATSQCNDMVVDASGRAYVGNFGFDIYTGEEPRETVLIAVEPDGTARAVAENIAFPNGSAITPDGRTLLVGESMGRRIRAFDIGSDGSLSNARVWAQIEHATVDGMCLDAEGAVWAACPYTGVCRRIAEGGGVLDEIRGSHPGIYACMLGGEDRRTLYLCTAPSHVPEETRAAHQGRIEAIRVDVPGAGLP
jgi:sugar lactone lactonase YvrE